MSRFCYELMAAIQDKYMFRSREGKETKRKYLLNCDQNLVYQYIKTPGEEYESAFGKVIRDVV